MEEKEIKKKPKYNNHSFFVWIVVLFLAWTLGQNIFPESNGVFLNDALLVSLIAIVAGYILVTFTYEIGKIIFGKISGYRLVYTNMLMFTFKRNNENKLKFKMDKFTHIGGTTIMAPVSEKSNLTLYSLGGIIFTIIINVILIIVTNIIGRANNYEEIIYFQYIMSAVALLILVFHIAPVFNDEIYDGFVLRVCSSNSEVKKQYHNYLLQEEVMIKEDNNLLLIENINLENPLLSKACLYNCYYYLKNANMEKAYLEAKNYLENYLYLLDEEKGKLYSLKYYFMILEGKEELVNEEMHSLEGNLKRIITSDKNYGTIKTSLLNAVFIESSYDLYEYILGRIDKNKHKYYASLQEVEEKLIEHTLSYIQKKKVDWFRNDNQNEE